MSASYFIDISIRASFDEVCLCRLLTMGKTLGFLYLDRRDYCDYLANIKEFLSIDKAVIHLLMSNKIHSIDDDFPAGLAVSYQGTYFLLFVYHDPDRDGLKIILMSMLYDWTKIYDAEEYFDFGRYIDILINICVDFPILNIGIRTER